MNETAAGFVTQCKRYFGLLPGQVLVDFMHEIKKLTSEDKAEITEWFNANGYPVKD